MCDFIRENIKDFIRNKTHLPNNGNLEGRYEHDADAGRHLVPGFILEGLDEEYRQVLKRLVVQTRIGNYPDSCRVFAKYQCQNYRILAKSHR